MMLEFLIIDIIIVTIYGIALIVMLITKASSDKIITATVFWDSWDGLLNVTQTGMNSSGEPFAFSMDNDRNLIDTLVKAQVEGWKIKIKYHQVWGCKNVFKNRGESDYFVDDVIILDKNFSKIGDIVKGTNKTVPHDTLYVKIVK